MAQSVWIIAGEESGDAYGAGLARELLQQRPGLVLRGMGGRAMAAAGVEILVDSSELGVVGFVEVLRHLRTILRALAVLVERAAQERPAGVVLIDYPGFNLRLARRLHALGIPVVYYVSPQVWAWKRGRRHQMAAWCRRLLCIFPFEPPHFADTGLDVHFVGHPLLEILAGEREGAARRDPEVVLLLPGSRRGEIERLLPPMLQTAAELRRRHPRLRFVIPLPRPATVEVAQRCLQEAEPGLASAVSIEVGRTRHWLQVAVAGLATSGTVTMEAAILGLPVVSVYRVSWLTYGIGRLLVHGIRFFTIVNLVVDREVFEEFLQGQVTVGRLVPAMEAILPGGVRRDAVLQGMAAAVAALGPTGAVSATAARLVLETCAGDGTARPGHA